MRNFNWQWVLYSTALLSAIAFVIGDDLTQILIFFLGVPALALSLVFLLLAATVSKLWRNLLWIAGAIVLFFASSAALIAYQRGDPYCIRSTVRWIFESHQYKAEVLGQKRSTTGELSHVEWDGWGFPGAGDTVMYLIYDPSDSLLNASKRGIYGAVPGIPCPVDRFHRLETHWYTVLFPTDSSWNSCAPS